MFRTLIVVAALLAVVNADLFMHNMRGSNNRLNENNQNRNNANRLFDSQNNNQGGYNVGDTDTQNGQGTMKYYESSILRIEWTNQHGALNQNVNAALIWQYMCNVNTPPYDATLNNGLRDGTSTNRINTGDPGNTANGKHEPVLMYTDCQTRERNKGLFLADQTNNLNGDEAIYTRQNTNGNRHGFECTEERDYYPYWHPSPWIDIIILTSNTTQCELYQTQSQNVQGKNYCDDPQYNNAADCTENNANWLLSPSHQETFPAANIAAPLCEEVGWSRDNHLGNTIGGNTLNFNWTIPTPLLGTTTDCVLRARYNVSTNDYDSWNTYAESNDEESPIQDNPTVNFGEGEEIISVKLALNTDQYGRTFQDRSHVFQIMPKPTTGPGSTGQIYNLNVRGRRGNIVQTYPSVEYDYVPNDLTVSAADYVHIQWTGSLNTPDGAGQGQASTDRSNIVQIPAQAMNRPLTFNDPAPALFPDLNDKIRFATVDTTPVQEELDTSPAYYDGGLVQPAGGVPGTYHYMCTRNNNFTNRDQKGILTVV